ncbi:MAG TPA: 3-keto-5-aminohexanoate cleavage protein [Desulfobacteraceae bacterium]|jgi:3-keto-5-aminohexanoate cleavage enzyme|nr:3-keto-5-aminohexanoate cleavage protein [Desulfobacteraceae bacterium]
MEKLIVTVALTGGVHGKASNPNLPEQPDEIAVEARRSYDEGASIAHIHARDTQGVPTGDPEVYMDIADRLKEQCPMVIQFSTGGGANLNREQKAACLEAAPEMASLNMGTMLRTVGPRAGTPFVNSRQDIEFYARKMHRRGIKPEMEIYHHGMLAEVKHLIESGLLEKPYYINFVLNMAYQGAVAGTPENLVTLRSLLPKDSMFNVTAIGAAQLPMTTLGMLLGGMVRVGLEDNIYYTKGVPAESNAQLVARTVRIAREIGFEIASPEDARKILCLRKGKSS